MRFTVLLAFLIASTQAAPPSVEKSIPVRIEQTPKGWRLLRDGLPYFVKGACVWGENVRASDLKDAGANSLRTYHSKYARWTLDAVTVESEVGRVQVHDAASLVNTLVAHVKGCQALAQQKKLRHGSTTC